MSLFQKSVEKKYLNEFDANLIDKKFQIFLDYFGNPDIQENINSINEQGNIFTFYPEINSNGTNS